MEYSMELWCRQMTYHLVRWNSMEHSMELWCRQMKYHLVPWNSMELWDCHFMTCYPGLPRNIPRNSTEFWSRQIKNHKISPSSMGFHGIRRAPFQMTHVPWNSMAVWCRQMKYHLVPWNSMELWDCHVIQCHATLDFLWIDHEIPWNSIEWPNKKSPSSMGFHGSRSAPLQMAQVFHGIPWNIPWNSMELWCRQMIYQWVPWNSMGYSIEFHGTLVPPNDISLSSMEFHATFHGIPWNFSVAKWSITKFHGIPWNFEIAILWHFTLAGLTRDIPWNSVELWCQQIKNHRVPWDSMELGGHHIKWHKYFMEFHGIPWNSGAAKWHIT